MSECQHESVRYSAEHNNFYCNECNQGMGTSYWKAAKSAMQLTEKVKSLESQLAVRNQAAEAMGVLERLARNELSHIDVHHTSDPVKGHTWTVGGGFGYSEGDSLIEAVLKAGGGDATG